MDDVLESGLIDLGVFGGESGIETFKEKCLLIILLTSQVCKITYSLNR